jgi:hypothetical protein
MFSSRRRMHECRSGVLGVTYQEVRANTSKVALLSPATRFVAVEWYAVTRPLALSAGKALAPLAAAPRWRCSPACSARRVLRRCR